MGGLCRGGLSTEVDWSSQLAASGVGEVEGGRVVPVFCEVTVGYNRRRSISGLFQIANDVTAELLYRGDVERGGVFECGDEGVNLGGLSGFSVCGG